MKLFYQPILQYGDGTDTAALIAGTSQLASSAINAMSVSGSSRKDRQFMQDMYKQQRTDALADRDYANTYNSPTNEMARLKAAGLNPNLIYGKAGGDMASAPVRSSSYIPYKRNVPDAGAAASAIGTYFQVKAQQQQLDNMQAQNHLLNAQTDEVQSRADLNRANVDVSKTKVGNILADTDLKTFQYRLNTETEGLTVQIKQGQLNKLNADVQFTIDENQRQAITNVVNVSEGLKRLVLLDAQTALTWENKAKAQAEIDYINSNTAIKKLDKAYIDATGNKGRPGDPALTKLITQLYGLISNYKGGDSTEAKKNIPGLQPDGYIQPDVNQ